MNCALSLEILIEKLGRVTATANDASDRSEWNSDEYLRGELGMLIEISEPIFDRVSEDYSEDLLKRLEFKLEDARKAHSYLRSGAAEMQRALIEPAPQHMVKLKEIVMKKRRSNSPWCNIVVGESNGILSRLHVPNSRSVLVKHLLANCANLAQARFVLASMGLTTRYVDLSESSRVIACQEIAGEHIELIQPSKF